MLDPDGIRHHLADAGAWEIHVASEVESTNDAVLTFSREKGSMGSVLFAEKQSAGRGRRGNVWSSGAPGSDLLFSCAVRPPGPAASWSRLTHVTALALKRAFERYPPVRPLVKWPNDIYVKEKKVSGILVETEMCGTNHGVAVIGIGVNVNGSLDDLPSEFRSRATSLRAETQTLINREMLAAHILDHLTESLRLLPGKFHRVIEELREAHYLLGKPLRVRLGQGTREGIAIDLGPEGELIMETHGGTRLCLSSADDVRLISRPEW